MHLLSRLWSFNLSPNLMARYAASSYELKVTSFIRFMMSNAEVGTSRLSAVLICLFFFTDPVTAEIYTLSLHDALPILVDYLLDRQHHLRVGHERRHPVQVAGLFQILAGDHRQHAGDLQRRAGIDLENFRVGVRAARSEERRVGKECRSRWSQ